MTSEKSAPPTAAQLIEQGLFHHRQGQVQLAMERYTEVLRNNPENADALYYIAMVACADGQFDQGIALARRSLGFKPDQARAHNLIGQALDRQGKPLEALKSLDEAIRLDPDLAAAHGNRADILADAGFPEEALKSFDRALALNPMGFPEWTNRGSVLNELQRHEEALASFEKALTLVPDNPTALMNCAGTLSLLGRYDEALATYDRLLALNPKFAMAIARKGLTVKQTGRLAEARRLLEQALALDPNDHTTAYALARLLLQTSEWRKAWPLFERRAALPEPAYKPLDYPLWRGEAPGDFRLVLMSERGLGDAVHFARYAALLAGRRHAVTLLTTPELAPLMRTLPGVERVVISADELESDKRRVVWSPLNSTLGLLHLTPDTIPAQDPYLSAELARVADWRERLGSNGFKVGIVWSGETREGAMPLSSLAPLADIPGVRLISLQKQPDAGESDAVPFADRIERLLDANNAGPDALPELAAAMANLDLIVSVDGTAAHLAGALGRPVFVALRHVPDWRWFTAGDTTPWYATMRLFRQGAERQWRPVIERIAQAVRERIA